MVSVDTPRLTRAGAKALGVDVSFSPALPSGRKPRAAAPSAEKAAVPLCRLFDGVAEEAVAEEAAAPRCALSPLSSNAAAKARPLPPARSRRQRRQPGPQPRAGRLPGRGG